MTAAVTEPEKNACVLAGRGSLAPTAALRRCGPACLTAKGGTANARALVSHSRA